MKSILLTMTISIALVTLSCRRSVKLRQEKRNGINGEAVYVYGNNGNLKMVFKEAYSVHDFTVLIQRDTLRLGDQFYSNIIISRDSARVIIESPAYKEISYAPGDSSLHYYYEPTRTGVYDFHGKLHFDSALFHFEYKFIVIK